jgi:hypothetical protein
VRRGTERRDSFDLTGSAISSDFDEHLARDKDMSKFARNNSDIKVVSNFGGHGGEKNKNRKDHLLDSWDT